MVRYIVISKDGKHSFLNGFSISSGKFKADLSSTEFLEFKTKEQLRLCLRLCDYLRSELSDLGYKITLQQHK